MLKVNGRFVAVAKIAANGKAVGAVADLKYKSLINNKK